MPNKVDEELILPASLRRAVGFGIAGGLVGTALMDIVLVLTFIMVGAPADAFFSTVGERLGDGALAGLAVHNLVGLTGGLVFSLLVSFFKPLRIDSWRKGVGLGFIAGALTIPLGCIPFALWLNQPVLEVIAFSVLPHLVWGTTLGWFVGYGLISYGHKPMSATGPL